MAVTKNFILFSSLVSSPLAIKLSEVETLDLIESRMKQLTEQLPPAFGATGSLHFHRNYPPTLNDPKQTAFAASVMTLAIWADVRLVPAVAVSMENSRPAPRPAAISRAYFQAGITM